MTVVDNQQIHVPARREYSAPQFVQYGSVSDLTAGGSGHAKEGNNGNGKPRP